MIGWRARAALDTALRSGLERLTHSGPVFVPEYPLDIRARWGWSGSPVLGPVAELISARSPDYEAAVRSACGLADWARTIPRTTDQPGEPRWDSDWWGSVDALVQCAALKQRDPALYVEIGSGMSTLFARKAISDFGLRTRIVSVDPEPRSEVDRCCDESIREPLGAAVERVRGRVGPGDVVFIDASHVALMNTDATVFFLELLPQLPAGVLVGIDDVFLPYDYPPTWNRRMYGEQYLLAAFLLGGAGGFDLRFPGWWLTRCSALARRLDPVWPIVENRFGRVAASFWIERDPP